jgi:hypothetical protein
MLGQALLITAMSADIPQQPGPKVNNTHKLERLSRFWILGILHSYCPSAVLKSASCQRLVAETEGEYLAYAPDKYALQMCVAYLTY